MILVIGGAGFIGSAVVRILAGQGERVAVATTRPRRACALFEGLGVEIRQADVRDGASVDNALAGCSRVVVSVQFPGFPVEDPRRGRTFRAIDTEGTRRVAAAAARAGLKRLVYVSGVNVAPDAPQHWFRAKWESETAVRTSPTPWAIVRPTWVYGPGDRTLSRIAVAARWAPVVPLPGAGRQRLQPVYVGQAADAIVACLLRDEAVGGTYEIGGRDILTFDGVVRTVQDVVGRHVPIVHVPIGPIKALAALAAVTPWRPLTPDAVQFATMDAVADNRALVNVLGINPLPVRVGLERYMK